MPTIDDHIALCQKLAKNNPDRRDRMGLQELQSYLERIKLAPDDHMTVSTDDGDSTSKTNDLDGDDTSPVDNGLGDKTVAELQETLKSMDLPVSGKKSELIERIRTAVSPETP